MSRYTFSVSGVQDGAWITLNKGDMAVASMVWKMTEDGVHCCILALTSPLVSRTGRNRLSPAFISAFVGTRLRETFIIDLQVAMNALVDAYLSELRVIADHVNVEVVDLSPYTRLAGELDVRCKDLVGEVRSAIARKSWLTCVMLMARAESLAHYPDDLVGELWSMIMREASRVGGAYDLARAQRQSLSGASNKFKEMGLMLDQAMVKLGRGFTRVKRSEDAVGVRREKLLSPTMALFSYATIDPICKAPSRGYLIRYTSTGEPLAATLPSSVGEVSSLTGIEVGALRYPCTGSEAPVTMDRPADDYHYLWPGAERSSENFGVLSLSYGDLDYNVRDLIRSEPIEWIKRQAKSPHPVGWSGGSPEDQDAERYLLGPDGIEDMPAPAPAGNLADPTPGAAAVVTLPDGDMLIGRILPLSPYGRDAPIQQIRSIGERRSFNSRGVQELRFEGQLFRPDLLSDVPPTNEIMTLDLPSVIPSEGLVRHTWIDDDGHDGDDSEPEEDDYGDGGY